MRPASGALRRPGARARWALVAATVTGLVLTPVVVASRPGGAASPSTVAALAARVAHGRDTGYRGYAESSGRIALPDVEQLGGVVALLGDTTRMRVFHYSAAVERVDTLTLTAETDTYTDALGSWVWDSAKRRATFTSGSGGLHLPQAADLTPPNLGHRLLAAVPPAAVHSGPAKRVAGRTAQALVITPSDPETLIRRVTVWVDPATAVPLEVQIEPRGVANSLLTCRFLDFQAQPPPLPEVTFIPPPHARVDLVTAADAQTTADRLSPYRLPAQLDGLPRRGDIGGGAGDYGSAFHLVAVVGVEPRLADEVRGKLGALPTVRGAFGEATVARTPLVTALIVRTPTRGYLLAGTVSTAVLLRIADQLARNPPRRRFR